MRITKLLGTLLIVAGTFVGTRADGWSAVYVLAGLALAFAGVLLASVRKVRRFRVRGDRTAERQRLFRFSPVVRRSRLPSDGRVSPTPVLATAGAPVPRA